MTEDSKPDPLLDELNGGVGFPPLAPGESPVPLPQSRDEALTAKPPAAPNPVAAADAEFSTAAGGKGYCVTVTGEYVCHTGEGKNRARKAFKEDFNLPRLEAALSVIKNKLIKKRMARKYEGFIRVRTCSILETRPLSPGMPPINKIEHMNKEQLAEHIKHIRAPIDPAEYTDVMHLRDAVVDFILTPVEFSKRESARQAERQGDVELAQLNKPLGD